VRAFHEVEPPCPSWFSVSAQITMIGGFAILIALVRWSGRSQPSACARDGSVAASMATPLRGTGRFITRTVIRIRSGVTSWSGSGATSCGVSPEVR